MDRDEFEWLYAERSGVTVDEVFADEQLVMDLSTGDCESGWCMT